MDGYIPTPIIHEFKEINKGKYVSVKHYSLIRSINGDSLLSGEINISKDRSCARSLPDYWLKIRDGKNWSKFLTGLFKTNERFLFWGDIKEKQNLLLFHFYDTDLLTIYYFRNYFEKDMTKAIDLVAEIVIKQKKEAHNLF